VRTAYAGSYMTPKFELGQDIFVGIGEFAGLEFAGLENDGRSRRDLQDWKMTD